jgi:hypothetical protein
MDLDHQPLAELRVPEPLPDLVARRRSVPQVELLPLFGHVHVGAGALAQHRRQRLGRPSSPCTRKIVFGSGSAGHPVRQLVAGRRAR